jgi:actin-related protein
MSLSTLQKRRKRHRDERKSSGYPMETSSRQVDCIRFGHEPHVVQLGAERFRAPEILFNPELIGQEYAGVHQVVVDSINRVDLDLRKSLFSNIVLSGGSTLCRGSAFDLTRGMDAYFPQGSATGF